MGLPAHIQQNLAGTRQRLGHFTLRCRMTG
jgi:hypothetical protein